MRISEKGHLRLKLAAMIFALICMTSITGCAYVEPIKEEFSHPEWVQEREKTEELIKEKKMDEAGEHLLKSLRLIKDGDIKPSRYEVVKLDDAVGAYVDYKAKSIDKSSNEESLVTSKECLEIAELLDSAAIKALGKDNEVSKSLEPMLEELKKDIDEVESDLGNEKKGE